jgi:3-hydroxybutyryl-CoA dehydrogenase
MKLGMNHPMGPLALADLIGLDTCLAIMETLYDGFNDSKYRPCPLLRNMWKPAGWAGKPAEGFTSIRKRLRRLSGRVTNGRGANSLIVASSRH